MDERHWALLHPIIGAGSLGLTLLLTVPALYQALAKARHARRNRGADGDGGYEVIPQLFESADGQATAESVAAFSDRKPRIAAWVGLLLGLACSLTAAVLLSVHTGTILISLSATIRFPATSAAWLRVLDNWADVPVWALIVFQCASIPTKSQYDRRFLLVNIGFWSSIALLASLVFRYGFDIVYTVTGKAAPGDKGFAIGIAVCWLVETFSALAVALSFASFPHRPDVYYRGGLVDQQHAVSMLDRFGFSWNRVVFDVSKTRKLEADDLPNMDGDTRSSSVNARYLGLQGSAGGKKGRLWYQLVMAYRWPLFLQWVLTFIRSVLALFPQYVLYQFLEGLSRHKDGHKAANPRLWGWVIGLGASMVLQVWVGSVQRWLTTSRLEAPLNSLVQSLIFQKALRLDEAAEPGHKSESNAASSDKDKGDNKQKKKKNEKDSKKSNAGGGDVRQSVVNHMKLDSGRMMIFCTYNYWVPLALFKLVLAGYFLARLLGWVAVLSGLSCALLVYPITHYMSKKYAEIQFGLMKYRDGKAHVLTEALQGMRQIKYSALEHLYEKKILDSRNEELKQFWRIAKWTCCLSLVINAGPILLSCVSLGIYTLTSPTHVRASVIFASLGLFDQLDEAIGYLPIIQVYLLEAWTSCVRVEKYLNQPDKATVTVPGDCIAFENATVRWPSADDSKEPAEGEALIPDVASESASQSHSQTEPATRSTLRSADLVFPNKELSIITGKTGSGKSLLLAAILGEVKLLSGCIKVPEAPPVSAIEDKNVTEANWILPSLTAFVSQTPWIESGTVKENILFGMPFRESRYRKVLEACALTKDIELLINGDSTEVGPKGVTLSGGQRWRLALARALYSRAGILILDDVLSAVDAHVGHIIVDQALTGELTNGRTRILATHHPETCLAKASYLVRLENGAVKSAEAINIGRIDEASSSSQAETPGNEADQAADDQDTGRAKKDEEERESGRVKSRVYREYVKASNSYLLWIALMALLVLTRLVSVASTWSLKELAGSYSNEENIRSHRFISQVSQPELIWHASALQPTPSQLTAPMEDSDYRRSATFWICAYIVFEVAVILIGACYQLLIIFTGLKASRVLFERMTHSILHAPLRWTDTIPTGRLLNRFTSDTFIVDRRLANDLGTFFSSAVNLVVIIIASVAVSPYIIIFGIILLILYGRIANVYISAAREAKRINSVAHSPVYDQFSSVLTGLSTIRAFHRTDFYMDRMFGMIDGAAKANWALQLLARWMNFRMGMFGAVFVTIVAFCIIFGNVEASLAGFGLVFALRYTGALTRLLANVTSIELGFNAAERILEYIEIDTEPETGHDVPAAWPTQGHIEVENLTVSYAPDLPPVLKELNFEVRPGERIGVVGRTGAGKSTLAAVFFRLLEPTQGSVSIDGVDIANLKLDQLRSRLAIIPQDPFLFAGTLRSNLDLDGSIDDYDLHRVLKRVHLVEPQEGDDTEQWPADAGDNAANSITSAGAEAVEEHTQEEVARLLEPTGADPIAEDDIANPPGGTGLVSDSTTEVASTIPEAGSATDDDANDSGNESHTEGDSDHVNAFKDLGMAISTGGGNLSQGQRQLVCLARALLTRPKIVVLDEATSAVDRGTDSAIQESLRREFATGGCTVLVIAHRLSTVADFDRILVLKEGRVAEMGTPKELIERGLALDDEKKASKAATTDQPETDGSEDDRADGTGVFWDLVKQSSEKEKLLKMVLGEKATSA